MLVLAQITRCFLGRKTSKGGKCSTHEINIMHALQQELVTPQIQFKAENVHDDSKMKLDGYA